MATANSPFIMPTGMLSETLPVQLSKNPPELVHETLAAP